jgi:hypothetical protein
VQAISHSSALRRSSRYCGRPFRVDPAAFRDDLLEFLRASSCLAVRHGGDEIEFHRLHSSHDRAAVAATVQVWRQQTQRHGRGASGLAAVVDLELDASALVANTVPAIDHGLDHPQAATGSGIETRRLQTLSPDTLAGILDLDTQGWTEATNSDGDPLAVAEADVANAVRDEFAHRQLGAKGRVRGEVRYEATDRGACIARRLRARRQPYLELFCRLVRHLQPLRLAADAFFAVPAHL